MKCDVHTDPVYSVTVITDPPSGPHFIGSTVNFTCLIHPQPPEEGVTYHWTGYSQSPSVANTSLPYATLTIGRGHPHTARYYCRVYYRNQVFATGSIVITVQGRLHNLLPITLLRIVISYCTACVQVCCLQLDQLLSSITLPTLSSCKSILLQLQHSPGTT